MSFFFSAALTTYQVLLHLSAVAGDSAEAILARQFERNDEDIAGGASDAGSAGQTISPAAALKR